MNWGIISGQSILIGAVGTYLMEQQEGLILVIREKALAEQLEKLLSMQL
jgi:hypothetical protein